MESGEQRRLLILLLLPRGRKTLGRGDERTTLSLWIWRRGRGRVMRSERGLIWSLGSRRRGLRMEWRTVDANDRLRHSLGRILVVRGEVEGSRLDVEDEVGVEVVLS